MSGNTTATTDSDSQVHVMSTEDNTQAGKQTDNDESSTTSKRARVVTAETAFGDDPNKRSVIKRLEVRVALFCVVAPAARASEVARFCHAPCTT